MLALLEIFGSNSAVKPSGPGLLFAGRFLITVSISVLERINSHLAFTPCIFTGRTDAEAEAPKLWSPDTKT